MENNTASNISFSIPRDLLKIARILSLDVALGALAGGLMVRRLFGIEMPWVWFWLLPLSVWVIYTLDHLLDARQLGENSETPRHRFHHVYFAPIVFVWGMVSAACGILALLFLDQNCLTFGGIMIGFVLLHLFLVKLVGDRTSPFFIKEMGVAGIYALGIWGMPMVLAFFEGPALDWWLATGIFAQYLLLSLVNLIEFSLYEIEVDRRHGHSSFVRGVGEKLSRGLIRLCFAAFVMLMGWILLRTGAEPIILVSEGILFAMALVLFLINERSVWFLQKEKYRSWGDAVFLFPFVFELLDLSGASLS